MTVNGVHHLVISRAGAEANEAIWANQDRATIGHTASCRRELCIGSVDNRNKSTPVFAQMVQARRAPPRLAVIAIDGYKEFCFSFFGAK